MGASILLSVLVVCGLYGTAHVLLASGQKEHLLDRVDRGEMLLLWLEARVLPVLTQRARVQVLPDSASELLFAEEVLSTDLAPLENGDTAPLDAFLAAAPAHHRGGDRRGQAARRGGGHPELARRLGRARPS